jgi:hypothetical protein
LGSLAEVRVARSAWWAAASVGVVFVGAFGPWAKAFGLRIDGSDDEVVVVAACVASVGLGLLAVTRSPRLALVPLLVGLFLAMLIGHDVSDPAGPLGGRGPNIRLEWGIWTALAGSISLALASVLVAAEVKGVRVRRRQPTQTRSRAVPPFPAGRSPSASSGNPTSHSEAKARRAVLVPQIRAYGSLDRVLWPIVTATAKPDFKSPVVNTDSRGHRVTRVGTATARSDSAPDGAAFLLGGSYAFGVGASDDANTLAASLWRRTGSPFVNLAIRAANSAQELVAVLPFAEQETTFVVCSGLNNLATARGAVGLDPLFGPMHHEAQFKTVSSVSIATLSRLVNKPLALVENDDLRRELERRQGISVRARIQKRIRTRLSGSAEVPQEVRRRPDEPKMEADEILADAAARQLRDLRLLRNLVPGGARVLFALQPVAPYTGKELTPEEDELFGLLDMLQPTRWLQVKRLLEAHWRSYASSLRQGCADAGIPFVDLGRGDYTGWCFIDRVHGTDRGYDIAGELIANVLAGAPGESLS